MILYFPTLLKNYKTFKKSHSPLGAPVSNNVLSIMYTYQKDFLPSSSVFWINVSLRIILQKKKGLKTKKLKFQLASDDQKAKASEKIFDKQSCSLFLAD